jgi:hypothetical protein
MDVELDRARGQIASEIQLMAYELVDELVFDWHQEPVFDRTTPVVLAEVTVPVGLGTGIATLLENHIAAVLIDNPETNVQLVHCPQCTAVIVHSGPEGTLVSRGYDSPDVLAELGSRSNKHALFIDIEAEGADLVLRARLTGLTPDLPIVWSRSLATSVSTPVMLRASDSLKSSADARQEYMDILRSRGPLFLTVRLNVRTFAQPDNSDGVPPPPFLWLQAGVDLGATQARRWTSTLVVGASHVPIAYSGLMAEARVSRLLTGRSRSLTQPDLYLFFGTSLMTVWGLSAASFQDDIPDVDGALATLLERDPRTTLGTLHLGLDLRVGQRIGMTVFIETLPGRGSSQNLGTFVKVPGLSLHTIGTEVSLWF